MQAGPAGILSHREVYSSIYNTLRQTFKYVMPYAAHVPSFADTWGWVMASDQAFPMIKMEETNYRIQNRIQGELHFLDGQTLCATLALNKHVWKT
jgi:thermospermine synthase